VHRGQNSRRDNQLLRFLHGESAFEMIFEDAG
jgi:hypothetical protein